MYLNLKTKKTKKNKTKTKKSDEMRTSLTYQELRHHLVALIAALLSRQLLVS